MFQIICKVFAFIKYDTSQKTLSQLSYLSQICDFSLVTHCFSEILCKGTHFHGE